LRLLLVLFGYTVNIKTKGEEATEKKEIPNYRARGWVVERTHSWMNHFRRLLIRWEKKKVSKNIYTCPCPGSGAKDMPSKEKVIT